MRHLFHHHRWDQSKVNHIMPPLIWWDSMEGLQLVTIHFKNSASSFIFYMYNTMGENVSNNERTIPPRSKLTNYQFQAGVKQQHILANMELLTKEPRIVKSLDSLFIDVRVLISL